MATPHTPTASAKRALTLALGASSIAWLLFVGARLSNVFVTVGFTADELWGPNAVVIVQPSTYLLFAAIALLCLGGLWAKRLATRAQLDDPLAALPRAVRGFAATITTIGLACAALAAIYLFLENFSSPADRFTVMQRVLSAYLPIVLYTALVLTVILAAFVFAATPPQPVPVTHDSKKPIETSPEVRRATALAFTLPITAAMVALIFGLIIYDVTQTSLEAWVWVLVQLVIAGGLVAGTVCAARAVRTQLRGRRPEGVRLGASRGSSQLNFALSIVFAVVVGLMSMGYGSAAAEQLRVQPTLSFSAYVSGSQESLGDTSSEVVTLNVYGSDLARGSEVTVTLEPSGETIATERVGRDGYLWLDYSGDPSVYEGSDEVVANAVATDLEPVTARLMIESIGVLDDSDAQSVNDVTEPSRLMTPSLGWALEDFAPALVLLLLAEGTLYLTLTVRNSGPGPRHRSTSDPDASTATPPAKL